MDWVEQFCVTLDRSFSMQLEDFVQRLQGDREGGGDVDVVNYLMDMVDQGAVLFNFGLWTGPSASLKIQYSVCRVTGRVVGTST